VLLKLFRIAACMICFLSSQFSFADGDSIHKFGTVTTESGDKLEFSYYPNNDDHYAIKKTSPNGTISLEYFHTRDDLKESLEKRKGADKVYFGLIEKIHSAIAKFDSEVWHAGKEKREVRINRETMGVGDWKLTDAATLEKILKITQDQKTITKGALDVSDRDSVADRQVKEVLDADYKRLSTEETELMQKLKKLHTENQSSSTDTVSEPTPENSKPK